MKKIFKYPINVGYNEVHIPSGGKVVHFDSQSSFGYPQLCIWVEVSPDMLPANCKFEVHGTGQPIPEDGRAYVATCLSGSYVWHLYEVSH